MANSTISNKNTEAVVVDTAPASGGYWTTGVLNKKIYMSARGTGVSVPTLQFRATIDEDWTDFYNAGTAFEIGDVYEIDTDTTALEWRIGVKEGDYTSGEVTLGLNW